MTLSATVEAYLNKKIARLNSRKARPEEAANVAAINAKIAELQALLPE